MTSHSMAATSSRTGHLFRQCQQESASHFGKIGVIEEGHIDIPAGRQHPIETTRINLPRCQKMGACHKREGGCSAKNLGRSTPCLSLTFSLFGSPNPRKIALTALKSRKMAGFGRILGQKPQKTAVFGDFEPNLMSGYAVSQGRGLGDALSRPVNDPRRAGVVLAALR